MIMRTKRGKDVFSPCTFEHMPYTKHAYGRGINLNTKDIVKLQKTNPRAYVHVLYSDQITSRFVQVRNLIINKVWLSRISNDIAEGDSHGSNKYNTHE